MPGYKILMSENSPEWSSTNRLKGEKREALVNWAKGDEPGIVSVLNTV